MALFGYKEWKWVCDVLGRGGQTILLRKGGISEGKAGFRWLHPEFFLFPTYFHEQAAQLRADRVPDLDPLPEGGEPDPVEITLFATVAETRRLVDPADLDALEPFHVWTREVVEERFRWGEAPGLSLALVRVHRLREPWRLARRPSFGGCRSWLGLPEGEGLAADWRETLEPVLREEDIGRVRAALPRGT
jgi:hypothetical protein